MLDVVTRCLHQVDAEQHETAYALLGAALAAVHGLVLEEHVGQYADQPRVGGIQDVEDPDGVQAAGDEEGGALHEAPGDADLARIHAEVGDVVALQRHVGRVTGGRQLADPVAVAVGGRGGSRERERSEAGGEQGGQQQDQ